MSERELPLRCHGIVCSLHSDCLFYHATEGADPLSPAIATCGQTHPLYRRCTWQAYEKRKTEFIAANPRASAEEIEAACRAAADAEGL